MDGKGEDDFFQKVPLWAIVAAGLGLLLLLTVLTLIFLCKHRKKQSSSKDGDPPHTIYEEVEDSRPRRNANGNAQSRIVGNTIYAEINCNPQVADCTVYAAVQRHIQGGWFSCRFKKPLRDPGILKCSIHLHLILGICIPSFRSPSLQDTTFLSLKAFSLWSKLLADGQTSTCADEHSFDLRRLDVRDLGFFLLALRVEISQ
ncbi:sorting nexin-29 [Platysternon megacephalum]|uniref:Sorting nexin-29 n=1 Tax=Platysternon megacephalum TaxID=55544 RepID=A0A4D9EK90_9SAUR|nr:sorting nexin-29 [Platysternon megacephalum]